jgi:peptidoglycan/LPS O-acetylase OafA/YrhL
MEEAILGGAVSKQGGARATPARTQHATRHYPALDGLRGVAALVVVAYHTALYFQLRYVPAHAYLAVDFFFMLSGYVIAYAYDGRLSGGMGVPRFMQVRLIRLYPLAILGVCGGTLALLVRSHLDAQLNAGAVLQAALANAFLLPTTALLKIRPLAFPTDSPLWSLAFEIWINLLYALLFRVLIRLVLTTILILGAVLLVWTAIAHGGLNVGFYFTDIYLGGIRVVFPFVAGVLLQRVVIHRFARTMTTNLAHAALFPLILVLAGPNFGSGIYDAAAVIICFPAILCLATLAPAAASLDRIWSALGALSYPLYVLHFPIVVVVSNVAHQNHLHGSMLYMAAIGTFAAAIGVSVVAYNIYDLPFRRALTKRFVAPTVRVETSSAVIS